MDRRRGAVVVVLVMLGAGLVAAFVRVGDRPASPPVPSATVAETAPRVLHAWDGRRARAYAAGSPERLRDLYVAGSSAGAIDVHLLGAYRSRGLRVAGMRTQVLTLAVVEQRRDRWRLRVTDRLDRAVAVGRGHRVVLPRDGPSIRELTLMRDGDGRWRVAEVVDHP